MFDLNPNLEIKEEVLQGSVIYYIDNFYLYPEEVDEYLFGGETPLHKIEETLDVANKIINSNNLINNIIDLRIPNQLILSNE